jgi:hypothetical protein
MTYHVVSEPTSVHLSRADEFLDTARSRSHERLATTGGPSDNPCALFLN